MTISTTNTKNSYAGNGSTSVFQYTFKISLDSEIQVIIRASSGAETIKTITTHYTVSGAGNASGGNVTFTSGNIPASGETVIIRRNTGQTQTLDLVENDPFSAETVEGAFDKSISLVQELQEQLDRSIKVSRSATITTPEITDDASARAGKLLGFDSTGNVLDATIDGSGIAVSATAAANSATASASSATAAAGSATSAENAKNAAEAALDTFDDDFLGSKSSNPSVDNDGNTLADGALYFDTTNNVMKVYDLGNTVWKQLTPTSSQQTNIDAAVSNATNINNVGGQIAPTNNIGTLAGLNTEIAGLYAIRTDISGVNTIAANVTAVKNNETNINAVNSNKTNIDTLAGITNLGNLANAHAAVTNVNNNLLSVNNFGEVYRISSSAPTSSLNAGDLYFDTTADELKVYKSGGWAAAGSTVNGTSSRFTYNITGTPTTLTGASGTGYSEASSKTLAYDAGFVDVYLNGVKQVNGTDVTVTSGSSVVFASALAANDVVDVVAFGTFQLANININDLTNTPASLGSAGQALVVNNAGNALVYSNASTPEVYGFEMYYNASTLTKTVTVQSVGGSNKYFIDGVQQDTLDLYEGNTYKFDLSDSSTASHPFRFATAADAAGSTEYTTGVTTSGTQGQAGAYVQIVVASNAPTLYYYCSSHSGMGGTANTPIPANNSLRVITTNEGADNISSATYANFGDVVFASSGITWSLVNTELVATI